MNVRLISITPEAEKTIIYIARVSSKKQDNPEIAGLIRYCIEHQHWSIFEQSHMTLEIETSRAISAQIIRHRSFSFQEFSQRYANAADLGFEDIEWRLQAEKNRQSSLNLADEHTLNQLQKEWGFLQRRIEDFYNAALVIGIAKECARMVLPMCTATKLYMSGSIRSWIHWIQLRSQPDTQLEHRLVALETQKIFIEQLPTIAEALKWKI